MSENYKPGTVAVATVRGVPCVSVVRAGASEIDGSDRWFTPNYQLSNTGNGWWPADSEVTDVRPLVVLDLTEIVAKAEVLGSHGLADAKDRWATVVRWLRAEDNIAALAIADQIDAQTRPPKPAEPTEMGAVVETQGGRHWVRVAPAMDGTLYPWHSGKDEHAYEDLNVVKVIRESVAR